MARCSFLTVALALLLGLVPPVSAETFEQGEEVSLSVGQIPGGYAVYWASSLDGYLGEGSSLRTTSLSIGAHEISVLIYGTSTWELVWQGSLTVDVVTPAALSQPRSAKPPR